MSTNLLHDGPVDAPVTFLFAHGAGAPMSSDWMETMARLIASHGIRVTRFEFPYMAARRTGRRRGPDRLATLIQAWRTTISEAPVTGRLCIGGKSLGGRIASMIADEAGVSGLVCFGYPFHPPAQPDRLRTEHLRDLETRTLVLQGERDPFGTPEEIASYPLSPSITVSYLPDGDHSFKPRKRSGHTMSSNMELAATAAGRFLSSLGT